MHCLVKKYLASWIFIWHVNWGSICWPFLIAIVSVRFCYETYTTRNTLVWLFLNITLLKVNDYCCVVRGHCYFKVSICIRIFEQFIVLHWPVIYQLLCTTLCFFTHILVLLCVSVLVKTIFEELQSNNSSFTTHHMFCTLISCLLKIVVLSQIHHSLCH